MPQHAGESTTQQPERRRPASRRHTGDRRSGRDRRERPEPVPEDRRRGLERRRGTERRRYADRRRGHPSDQPGSLSARLRALTGLRLTEAEARVHLEAVERHRAQLAERVGRDVRDPVALLDYFLNLEPRLTDPVVIERTDVEALRRSATSDPLTGLFNRQYLESMMQREMQRGARSRGRFSLLLLDVDGLKPMNDRHGHAVGDAVLRDLGTILRRNLRAADVPCRYGGDEFAILLPDTEPGRAVLVGERLRATVETHFMKTPVGGQQLGVTVSGGLAGFPTDASTPGELVAVADRALYLVKHAAGNRVAWPAGAGRGQRTSRT